jgi:AcrR family transcriptional regulator
MAGKQKDIVAAAERLFYREGFASVGIDRIVGEAGVALGTLYRHFKGRADLVVGALEHREAAFFEALARAASAREGEDRVLCLFDALGDWTARNGGNGCFFLRAASAHPDDTAICGAVMAHKRAYLDLVRQELVEAGWSPAQAERLAPRLFLLLEGAVAAAPVLGDDIAVAQARDAARALLRVDVPDR